MDSAAIWTIERDELAKITHVTARSRCGTSEERVPLSRKHCNHFLVSRTDGT